MKALLLLLLTSLLVVSCRTYSEDDKNQFDEKIEAYLKKKKIQCERSDSGLYYKILEQGSGKKIQLKDKVSFTYKGTFLNGKTFDERVEPLEFQVEELIGAWQEAMLFLNEGGKAFLVTPPQLGYGTHKLNDIPPNSILVYELEVLSVK